MIVLRHKSLSLQPRVRRQGKQLMVTPSWLLQILTLGAYGLTVHVDGEAGYVYIQLRRFWFFSQARVVSFKQIERICYEYYGLPTSWDIFGRVHDELERFRVSLALRGTEERVHVGSFYGEGAAGSLATLLMGDDLFDLAGTQELDSRQFVEQLCALTGATLTGPVKRITDAQGRAWRCHACGRTVAPRPKCLYCGGETAPAKSKRGML